MKNHEPQTRSLRTRRGAHLVGAGVIAGALLVGSVACSSGETATETSTTSAPSTTAAAAALVSVSDPWARQSPMMASMGAAYMNLVGGDTDDALVSASVPTSVAASVELHETTMSDDSAGDSSMDDSMGDSMDGPMDDSMNGGGMMTMKQVTSIPIPAGQTVNLEPGGYHVMLIDLAGPLTPGTTLELTLTFASGETLTVPTEVRAA